MTKPTTVSSTASSTVTPTATKVRDLRPGAALYNLSPPVLHPPADELFDGESQSETTYVMVSVAWDGSETAIFAADAAGEIVNGATLPGSTTGVVSHAKVLASAGYQLA